VETNWSNYVYFFEGGWYENTTDRYINTFDTEHHDNIFKLWISFLIIDGSVIDFNTLVDMSEFIKDNAGNYNDFMGTSTLDQLYG